MCGSLEYERVCLPALEKGKVWTKFEDFLQDVVWGCCFVAAEKRMFHFVNCFFWLNKVIGLLQNWIFNLFVQDL